METSKAYKLLLFTSDNCLPCDGVKERFRNIFRRHPKYTSYVSYINKTTLPNMHSIYNVSRTPTLIILDNNLMEINRIEGANHLTLSYLKNALFLINKNRND